MIGRAWKLEDFNAFLHFVSVLNFVACRDDRGIHATLLEADDEEETTVSGRKCATLCNAWRLLESSCHDIIGILHFPCY